MSPQICLQANRMEAIPQLCQTDKDETINPHRLLNKNHSAGHGLPPCEPLVREIHPGALPNNTDQIVGLGCPPKQHGKTLIEGTT